MADTTKDKILTYALTPLSWIYGAVVSFRNYLFDKDILKSERFNIPVITVGNLTVGGTGKTPHVEYLIDYLSAVYNVAVLSRGYMRKTKGFVLACDKSTPDTIGDEPYQIYQKYGFRVKVAVCENRKTGIRELQKIDPNINLVILDDGFQHRFIKPKVSILLTEYNRPFYTDKLLPLGRLREAI
ncbi:MAG: tetraacyldisaccharide 4'-kinase, partial [Muribaculaceae bacterium]|nr:tetraacyldisaccharide 4'-kinase [Muribaculaceae bacterium]